MQEINMPDVKQGADLRHIYNWIYNGGSFGRKPTVADLDAKGYFPLLASKMIYWDTTNKDLRAHPNFETEELNSSGIQTRADYIQTINRNFSDIARLYAIGHNPHLGAESLEITTPVTLTIAGGAGLGAEQILIPALGTGLQSYLEKIIIGVNDDTVGAAGQLSILNGSGGAAIFSTFVCPGQPVELNCMCPLSSNDTALYVVIDKAGETALANDAEIVVQGYYRVI